MFPRFLFMKTCARKSQENPSFAKINHENYVQNSPFAKINLREMHFSRTAYQYNVTFSNFILGHLNVTQIKSYFRIMDKICFEALGRDVLKFKSPKAYKYFIEAKGNHKSWEAFEVFLHGTTLELIHMYAHDSLETISPIGFLVWQSQVQSPTLKLLCQLVLSFGLGIYVQRVGDRNNDISVSDAGRYTFANIFYGLKHPIYCELEYRDLKNKVLYPDPVKIQRQENLSYTTTTIQS